MTLCLLLAASPIPRGSPLAQVFVVPSPGCRSLRIHPRLSPIRSTAIEWRWPWRWIGAVRLPQPSAESAPPFSAYSLPFSVPCLCSPSVLPMLLPAFCSFSSVVHSVVTYFALKHSVTQREGGPFIGTFCAEKGWANETKIREGRTEEQKARGN